MSAESRATATWEGDLPNGKGSFSAASGTFSDVPVSWPQRIDRGQGGTSPEELLAAAHAACYCMAFSNTLAKNGTVAERLNVEAVATFDQIEGGRKIGSMTLTVNGRVPGLDQAQFEELAAKAEQGCPVSNALRNNVTITVHATLQS